MSDFARWLVDLSPGAAADGIVPVNGYDRTTMAPEEVVVMEKAETYGAQAVFFEAPKEGKPATAQAFIYCSNGRETNEMFAQRHQQLWSWGGVPLVYRVSNGLVQLFRCAHRPDFEKDGKVIFNPFRTLKLAAKIANDPWWDSNRLRNGTLWDDPEVCRKLLSSDQAAQKTLIRAVRKLHEELSTKEILPKALGRKLLILSVLIAYLEERQVFEDGFFGRFRSNATKFFQVLENGAALVKLLEALEDRFNGHVFVLSAEDKATLLASSRLTQFARLVEGRQEANGQLTLWQRYSFADLPVELISHIYQLFVEDTSVAVYTPHFLVRMMLAEVLSWERLDRLEQNNEVILDGACGSGIFLVEAYKRLVLHWRSRNAWARPKQLVLKRLLASRIRGVDLDKGAVELAAFSLCLALCDALEPMEIRASVKLFPEIKEKYIHTGCFFESLSQARVKDKIGAIIGNPPFASKLATEGAKQAYQRYKRTHGDLPDKQVAYLFLHESMVALAPGGVLSMLQQYNFLYNQQSLGFRRRFVEHWDLREVLDFISVRGLFQKGDADTKVIVIVAEAQSPPPLRQILHATFRRSGRTDAEQGFDIDYYDLHWLKRDLVLKDDGIWRSNLLGGGRVLAFANRLKQGRTLAQYATKLGWDYGEGYIVGDRGRRVPASHITGQKSLPSEGLTGDSIDASKITYEQATLFRSAYTRKRFSSPMVLVHEQFDLNHGFWTEHYLTYKNQIVGFCGAESEIERLRALSEFLKKNKLALQAYVAATSVKLFTQHATTLSGADVFALPFPDSLTLHLSNHEEIVVADIVKYYRDLIRLGEDSVAMKEPGAPSLSAFNEVFTSRLNGVYKKTRLRALEAQILDGVVCQPYVFGRAEVELPSKGELKLKLDALLRDTRGAGLNVTRIARVYDGACVYLLKPNRLRYWLRSVALRDSDETLADLAVQGF